jgi:hypothetical protein
VLLAESGYDDQTKDRKMLGVCSVQCKRKNKKYVNRRVCRKADNINIGVR